MDTYSMSVELTKEQLELLRGYENPFDVARQELAYYIDKDNSVNGTDNWKSEDFVNLLPCKNKAIVIVRSKKERLSKLLWKFANENNDEPTDEDWKNEAIPKYKIGYDVADKTLYIQTNYGIKSFSEQYFKTLKICERAINEVVKPFIKREIY